MNNLIKPNMKRTIFEGTVNGEKFDNVQAYNARVNELIQSGELVSASTSTRVEEYEHSGYCRTCDDTPSLESTLTTTAENLPWERDCTDCVDPFEDDECSFYPYLDEDDPFYLDLLVTEHHDTNVEALNEVARVFEKSKRYIIDALEDPDTDIDTKKEYLEDLKEIIEDLVGDKKSTLDSIKSIDDKITGINDELEKFHKECEDKVEKLAKERYVLTESKPVIDAFLDFYRGVQSDTILSIKADQAKCKCGGKECQCDKNKNDVEKYKGVEIPDNKAVAECKEVQPQRELNDLSSILDRIFGPFKGLN
jgi:hypothetical protein